MAINETPAEANGTAVAIDGPPWDEMLVMVLKSIVLGSIIFAAVFGNLLIILSVCRNHKLRITTNYFIVSLAIADTLVAIFAMTFNASHTVMGRWLFSQTICDLWNSCDVLFSTASILHLCCISVDRYYAIVKPFQYRATINKKTVGVMLACVWVSASLISFVPIFLGWYTTDEHMVERYRHPDRCEFVVNKPYAVMSSCVSFWVPSLVMILAYTRIYREATIQEKQIRSNHLAAAAAAASNARTSTDTTAHMVVNTNHCHRNSHFDGGSDDQPTPSKRMNQYMKREHKAAKTLGIIVGAFIFCWLPFFIWYVTVSLCDTCSCPEIVVQILFWVGYFNSSLNPIIYAYFNRDFREAFKDTIFNFLCKWARNLCCKNSTGCCNNNRNEVHFNCTYRSTQDIGLVESKGVRDI